MFAFLHLTWKPSASEPTPPVGKSAAIVRGDTYAHTIRVIDGWLNNLQDNDYAAQLRRSRLTSSTADDPIAEFTVVEEQDGDDLLITIGLDADTTLDLPTDMFWDLQATAGDIITTVLTGKAKCLDDVTRVVAS